MPKIKQDDPEQSARFKALAEQLEASGDPAAFMEKLPTIIAAAPRKALPKPKKRKTASR